MRGSSFNKLIHAETVEKAVIDAAKTTLLDTPNLRQKLLDQIAGEAESSRTVDVDALKAERDEIRKRSQFIVASFDPETLADAQPELDRMKLRRRELDQQIAAAEASKQMPKMDAEAMVEKVLGKIENFFGEVPSLPNHVLKEWLAALVSKVLADMDTKDIEIHVALPMAMLESTFSDEKAMRLATTSPSLGSYETHPPASAALIAMIDCEFQKASNRICYACTRRAA